MHHHKKDYTYKCTLKASKVYMSCTCMSILNSNLLHQSTNYSGINIKVTYMYIHLQNSSNLIHVNFSEQKE